MLVNMFCFGWILRIKGYGSYISSVVSVIRVPDLVNTIYLVRYRRRLTVCHSLSIVNWPCFISKDRSMTSISANTLNVLKQFSWTSTSVPRINVLPLWLSIWWACVCEMLNLQRLWSNLLFGTQILFSILPSKVYNCLPVFFSGYLIFSGSLAAYFKVKIRRSVRSIKIVYSAKLYYLSARSRIRFEKLVFA
jgi:hypothetical protein